MAFDMTDLFHALYQQYAAFRGETDAYTLTEGRFYRMQAPDGAVKHGPVVVLSQAGGTISPMFSKDTIEMIVMQMSVFDEFKNDAKRATRVMKSLIGIYEYASILIPDSAVFVSMKREGMQTESIDDRTHVHIRQDWTVSQHVPAWR